MAMNNEEFKSAIQEMYRDAKDPDGELAALKEDFLSIYEDVKPHDQELASYLSDINTAMLKLEQYVIARVEG